MMAEGPPSEFVIRSRPLYQLTLDANSSGAATTVRMLSPDYNNSADTYAPQKNRAERRREAALARRGRR